MTSDSAQYDVHDGEPPLVVHNVRTVFQEHGGAKYRVEAIDVTARDTGQPFTFHVTSVKGGRPGAVCMALAPAANGRQRSFLLARHWRVSTGEWEWEFPRGMGEDEETATQTAIREFREETGMAVNPNQVTILQTMHADTGVLRDSIAVARIEIDLGTVGVHAGLSGDTDWELSNMRWIPEPVLRHMVSTGQIVDGITLAALAIELCRSMPK